jgi:hypothetical protein
LESLFPEENECYFKSVSSKDCLIIGNNLKGQQIIVIEPFFFSVFSCNKKDFVKTKLFTYLLKKPDFLLLKFPESKEFFSQFFIKSLSKDYIGENCNEKSQLPNVYKSTIPILKYLDEEPDIYIGDAVDFISKIFETNNFTSKEIENILVLLLVQYPSHSLERVAKITINSIVENPKKIFGQKPIYEVKLFHIFFIFYSFQIKCFFISFLTS